jgi:hypothetical protein
MTEDQFQQAVLELREVVSKTEALALDADRRIRQQTLDEVIADIKSTLDYTNGNSLVQYILERVEKLKETP